MANPLILKTTADDKMNVMLNKIDKNMKGLGKTSTGVGTIIKGVLGAKIISQGFEMMKRGFIAVTSEALKYEDQLKSIKGVTKGTKEGIDLLHKTLMQQTNVMEHVGSAAAQAALEVNKMGFTAKETAKALPHLMNLGTASMVDMQEAALVTMQTMKSFGKEISDVEHVVNVIQSTVAKTAIGFMDYAEAMKFIAPISKRMGVTLEETSAMVGILGDIGLKGSIAGTALKNILINLLRPGEAVADMISRMDNEGKGLIDVLTTMAKEGISTADFLETFNLRALPASLALSEMGTQVRGLTKSLIEEEITAKEVADTMRTSFSKQLEIVRNNLYNVGNEFIVAIAGATAFQSTINGMKSDLQDAQKWIIENKDAINSFMRSVGTLADFLTTVLAGSLKLIVGHFDSLAIAMRTMLAIMVFKKLSVGLVGFNITLSATKAIILSINPALAAFAAAMISADLVLKFYVDSVDKTLKKVDTLTVRSSENIKKQRDAVAEYMTALIKHGDKATELTKIQKLDRAIFGKGMFKTEFGESLATMTHDIELKFDLPKKFLSGMISSSKQAQRIWNQLDKDFNIALIAEQENTKALDENTKATKSEQEKLFDLLKKNLAERDAKKVEKAKSKIIDPTILNYTKLLGDSILDSMNKGYIRQNLLLEDMVKTFPLGKEGRTDIGVSSLATSEFSLFIDTFSSDLNSMSEKMTNELMKTRFSIEGSLGRGKLGGTFPITGMPTGITRPSAFDKPFSPLSFKGIPPLKFDIDLENIKAKFLEEQFNINLALSEISLNKIKRELEDLLISSELDKIFADILATTATETIPTDEDREAKLEAFTATADLVVDVWSNAINTISSLWNMQSQNAQKGFDKRLVNIKNERDFSLRMARDNATSKYLIERGFSKREIELTKDKEKVEKEFARKKRNAAVIQSIINTSLAITDIYARQPGNFTLKTIAATAIGILGTIQTGIIASQKLKSGGSVDSLGTYVQGRGTGVTDSIPTLLSDKEYVIKSKTAQDLGGRYGVEDMIEERLSLGTESRSINIYIENAYDDAEKIRETYREIAHEEMRYG